MESAEFPRQSDQLSPPTLVDAAHVVAPDHDPQGFATQWIEDNMSSIHQAVKSGRHNTLYYPASGYDLLRPLLAYDVDHLIAIDNEQDGLSVAADQLTELGIETKIHSSTDGQQRELTFKYQGRIRTIIAKQADARQSHPRDFGLPQVDVLHIYLPTGADIDLTQEGSLSIEDGNDQMIAPGISKGLSLINYQLVAEGGFFVLMKTHY